MELSEWAQKGNFIMECLVNIGMIMSLLVNFSRTKRILHKHSIVLVPMAGILGVAIIVGFFMAFTKTEYAVLNLLVNVLCVIALLFFVSIFLVSTILPVFFDKLFPPKNIVDNTKQHSPKKKINRIVNRSQKKP